MLSSFTYNKPEYMYSPITLSSCKHLYFNFPSGASTPLSSAQASCFFSLPVQSKFKSISLSTTLYVTMQSQEHLPSTHSDHHKDSDIFVQVVSCQFISILHNYLCNPEVGNSLQDYIDASVLSKHDLINFFLAIFLSWSTLQVSR